jgi:muramoyltetrapeptide carboxypeptidase
MKGYYFFHSGLLVCTLRLVGEVFFYFGASALLIKHRWSNRDNVRLDSKLHIGVFAPASSASAEAVESGLAAAKDIGCEVAIAAPLSTNYGKDIHLYSAGSIKERIAALRSLVENPSLNAIFTLRGGYGSMELLPHLQSIWEYWAKERKDLALVGLSDVTALLNCATRYDIPAIHGPSFLSTFTYGNQSPDKTSSAESTLSVLQGEGRGVEGLHLGSLQGVADLEGRILGGSLTVLVNLLGTPYEPDFTDKILFLEDTNERPYRILRMLQHLALSGAFAKIRGVILGDFMDCIASSGPSLEVVFKQFFAQYDFPVFTGLPAGHREKNLPVPIGGLLQVQGGVISKAQYLQL